MIDRKKFNANELIIYKNTALSLIAKTARVLFSFLQVSVILSIINPEEYGVWLVVFSVFSWIAIMDLGIANGLRNKLIIALAQQNFIKARQLISTAYVSLTGIVLLLLAFFFIFNQYLDWSRLLHVPSIVSDIDQAVMLSFSFIGIHLIAGIFNQVLAATQQTAVNDILPAVSDLLILAVITAFKFSSLPISLLHLAVIYSSIPFFVLLISTVYGFAGPFKHLCPAFGCFDSALIKDIASIGIKLFIIQMAGLVIFQFQTLYISNQFGPEQVAVFQVTYKYFSFSMLVFTILTNPYFPLFTHEYTHRNKVWLQNARNKLFKTWIGVTGLLVLMVLVSDFFFKIWLNNKLTVPFSLSLWMAIRLMFHYWCTFNYNILSSINVLNLQVIIGILSAIATIWLFPAFTNAYGLSGIPIVLTIILGINSVILYLQVSHELQKTGK
ncbi:MAG: hypothetical protein U0X91_17535 [Spirosomataceae bacterium]